MKYEKGAPFYHRLHGFGTVARQPIGSVIQWVEIDFDGYHVYCHVSSLQDFG